MHSEWAAGGHYAWFRGRVDSTLIETLMSMAFLPLPDYSSSNGPNIS